MQTVDVEMWACVDSDGQYAVGHDADNARGNYAENIAPLEDSEGFRLVKVTVKAPLPIVAELTGAVSEIGDPAELTAK